MSLYTPEEEIELCKADIKMAEHHRDQHQWAVNMFNGQIDTLRKRIDVLNGEPDRYHCADCGVNLAWNTRYQVVNPDRQSLTYVCPQHYEARTR